MAKGTFPATGSSLREPVCLALGGIIREERLRRGWTPAQLAARSGLQRQTINFLENHQRLARIETAERIGRAFGIWGSGLLALAEQRARQWPAPCQRCNNCCIEGGRHKWWNPAQGCIRPAR